MKKPSNFEKKLTFRKLDSAMGVKASDLVVQLVEYEMQDVLAHIDSKIDSVVKRTTRVIVISASMIGVLITILSFLTK